MTTYNRNERYSWRRYARRLVWRINYLLAALVLAAVLLPGVASAAPRCPGNGQCTGQPAGMVCAWPYRLVKVGNVAVCIRTAPEVQP